MKRGNPDTNSFVHLALPPTKKQIQCGEQIRFAVLCQNGAWHINFTLNEKEVTCPACLEELRNQ